VKVAVTGGAGLLGTPVLRRLLADRKIKEIVCLDLRPPSVPLGRLRYQRADVREAPERLAAHLAGAASVIHLAAVVTGHLPRAELDAINVGGSKNVFRAAALAGVPQVVYTSSLAAYGLVAGHAIPIVEDAPRRRDPVLAYAASKYDVEAFLDGFEREHPELAVVRLRPGIVIGARMENPLGDALRRGLMLGIDRTPMPSVWDEDVADAVGLAVARRARGAFNLVAGEPIAAPEIARAAGLRLVGLPRPLARLGARALAGASRLGLRAGADPAWLLLPAGADLTASNARARQDLGWSPRCPTTADVFRRFVDTVPRRLDARLALFFRLADLAARRQLLDEARHMESRVHLQLTGRRGGDVAIHVDRGRIRVRAGELPRPPTSVVRLPAEKFLELLAGRASFGTEQLTNRVLVEGQPEGAMLVAGMIGTFRTRLPSWLKEEAQA
jgi:nucleoside-diphosphate-sugar epimerase